MLESVAFLVIAALLPPVILMQVVYRMDRLEKEPKKLMVMLFIQGALAMLPILILELVADQFVDFFAWSPMLYLFLSYFVIPGFIEEGIKYRAIMRRVWNDANFDYRFDAVVYSVFVSLGFAAVENVMYVVSTGFSTAVVRAIFSIPGHAMFGVVMGVGLSTAKWQESHHQFEQAAAARKRAWIKAAVLHGFYDFLLVGFGGIFYVYFIGLVIYVVRLLRKSAREDGPIM